MYVKVSFISSINNRVLFAVGAFFAGLPFGYAIKMLGWNFAYLTLEFVATANILLCSYLLIKYYSSGASAVSVKKKE